MKKNISIAIEENLIDKIKEKSDKERRSVSNYIEGLILKDIKK